MSKKSDDVYRAGVIERGEFNPHGLPLRIYRYWSKNANQKHVPSQENFCHYWRVVALWAPLLFLRRGISKVFEHKTAWVVVTVAYVVIALLLGSISVAFPVVLVAVPYVVAGLIVAASAVEEGSWDGDKEIRQVMLPTAPVSFPLYWLISGIVKIPRNVKRKIGDIFLGTALVGLLATGAVGLVWAFIDNGAIVFGYIAGCIALAAAILGLLVGVGNYLKKLEHERRFRENAILDAWYDAHDGSPYPLGRKPKREPGRILKSFRAVGNGIWDFVVLAFQIARVKKWKICPLVNVPKS